jgi:hypothetical protein
MIVGHLVVPLVLAVETTFAPPYWIHVALWAPLTLGLALGFLQPIKARSSLANGRSACTASICAPQRGRVPLEAAAAARTPCGICHERIELVGHSRSHAIHWNGEQTKMAHGFESGSRAVRRNGA